MCTYTLSFTHLMKVGPSSDYNYLSIAWVAQVCCQLSLSGPVPAYVEEYLDDDEYDDNSVEGHSRRGRGRGGGKSPTKRWIVVLVGLLLNDKNRMLLQLYSHVPV